MSIRKAFVLVLVVALPVASLLAAGAAEDVDYTDRDIEIDIFVGFGAGGANDTSARYMAEAMREFGVDATVINMPGASGTEAVYHVSQQRPDSKAFMWAHSPMMLFEPASGDRGYTIDDFEPVGTLASPTFGVGSRADATWDTLDELIEYIEDNPGEVTFGGQGEANLSHFLVEKVLPPDELDYTYVSVGGGADVALNLEGGHVDVGSLSIAAAAPLVENDNLKMLYQQQILQERDSAMPDVPNIEEYGIDARSPHPLALWAPAGAPQELIDRVSSAMEQASQDEQLQERLTENGMVTYYLDADETMDLFMDFNENLVPEFLSWLEDLET